MSIKKKTYQKQKEIMARKRNLVGLILSLIAFAGCSEQKPSEPLSITPVSSPVMLPLAPEISAGDRPKLIRGARVFAVKDFVVARESKEVVKGEWVCVEGRVKRAGELWGTYNVTLYDPSNDKGLCCEGLELGKYRFEIDMNVIVYGMFSETCLIEPSLITQQEVELQTMRAIKQ